MYIKICQTAFFFLFNRSINCKRGVFVCERDRSSLRRSWRVGISVQTRSAVSPPTPSSFPSTPLIPAADGIRYACVRTQKYTNHPTARRPMVCVIAYTLTCILTYQVCFFFWTLKRVVFIIIWLNSHRNRLCNNNSLGDDTGKEVESSWTIRRQDAKYFSYV